MLGGLLVGGFLHSVEVLDCEVPGCVRFSPVTGGIGMLVWISDLGMKKGFPEITGNLPVELRGFEPLTLSMPWRCATSCAIAPWS